MQLWEARKLGRLVVVGEERGRGDGHDVMSVIGPYNQTPDNLAVAPVPKLTTND